MANAIPGKAFGLRFRNIYFECQTDLSFDVTAETETGDACKPNPSEPWEPVKFDEPTVSSANWTASVTAKATDALLNNQVTVLQTMKIGTEDELEIFTFDGDNSPLANEFMISGTAILTGFSLAGPNAGEATYDLTFTGKGDYVVTAIPATS